MKKIIVIVFLSYGFLWAQSVKNPGSICFNIWGQQFPSKEFCTQFNISYLPKTKKAEVYRIVESNSILEVQKKGNDYTGFFINYLIPLTEGTEHTFKQMDGYKVIANGGPVVFKRTEMDSATAHEIFVHLKTIDTIPDMSKIKGWARNTYDSWNPWLNSYTPLSIEHVVKGKYQLRNFWNIFDYIESLPEGTALYKCFDYVFRLAKTDAAWYAFLKDLPDGYYTTGNTSFNPKKKK